VAGDERQSVGAVGGGDHSVAAAGEDPLGHLTQGFFVLDDQDRRTGGGPFVGRLFLGRCGDLVGDGDQDREGGADAGQ
jgi:hypothetical protein